MVRIIDDGNPSLADRLLKRAEEVDEGIVQKAERVYLRSGEKPPKGVPIKTGPRGGRYYETPVRLAPATPEPSTAPDRQPAAEQPPWEKEAPDPIPWTEGGRERFASALESGLPDALDRFAEYEGQAIGSGLSLPPMAPGAAPIPLPPDIVLGWTHEGGPLRLMTWDTYREIKANEAGAGRPPPPLTRAVDRLITGRRSRDWNPDHEWSTVFDHDGSAVYRKKGGAHSVLFSKEELPYFAGKLFTHTHPSGNSFSNQDIAFACRTGLTEIRAIGPEWEYIMRPPEGMSRFTIGLFEGRIKDQLAPTDKDIFEELKPKIMKGELAPERAVFVHQDTLWTRIAAATGIRYIRRPADPDRWTEDQYLGTEEES